MIRKLMMVSMTLAGISFAQAPALSLPRAPSFSPGLVGACGTGLTAQRAVSGFYGCGATVRGHLSFTGPVVRQYESGQVEAVGRMENNLRVGKWQFFNKDGSLSAEITFSNDLYDGDRIEYGSNGQVTMHEIWVAGKREGLQTHYNAQGVASVVEYRNDRPVYASK